MKKIKNKKADVEIDKLIIWIISLIVLVILIVLAFKYKERLLDIIKSIGSIFRFGA